MVSMIYLLLLVEYKHTLEKETHQLLLVAFFISFGVALGIKIAIYP